MPIKTILIDSGKVLNGPKMGHWFIPPNFFKHVSKKQFKQVPKKVIKQAFKKALKTVDAYPIYNDLAQEFERFTHFYQVFFKQLPTLVVDEASIKSIAYDLVYNSSKYVFYKDALTALDTWKGHYKLGLISDAWPSLEEVFIDAGVRNHFDAFIISTCIGSKKPDALMYTSALDDTHTQPEDAVFIDDNIKNLKGARSVGIKTTYLMCRDLKSYLWYTVTQKDHVVVRDFKSLIKILEGALAKNK